jgi:predicted phage terminase large subunit-like protein
MEIPQSNFQIPRPTDWQREFLQKEEELQPRLIAICLGRRGGKSFIALLWVLLNRLGLLAGNSVAWVAPSDKVLGEARSWVKAWLDPFIVGPSPGGLGYRLQNGADLDFWSASPNAPQPLRSRGYACCVIDESSHYNINLRDTVDAAIRPALALSEGKLMFISTPSGRGDFYYYFVEAQKTGLALHGSSLVNPHFSEAEYKRLQRVTEPLLFRQEYGAEFLERSGALLRREQIRYGQPPPIETFRSVVAGLDLALSTKQRADYTAVTIAGVDRQDRRWVLAAYRWRLDWPDTFARILSLNDIWHFGVIQTEQVAFQELAVREMIDAGLPVTTMIPRGDKESRFAVIHQRYAMGLVWHNESLDAEYESEMLSYPLSDHDDWLDATTLALGTLFRELRTAMSEGNSGATWGSGLGHERNRRPAVMYDIHGNVHTYEPIQDYDEDEPAPAAEPVVKPAPTASFTERLVGDDLIMVACDDGRELLRIARGRSHLYYWQKNAGLDAAQIVENLKPYTKVES